ncbi:protein RocB [Lentibacillus kapialis]|uniref:Protein RocB n=1 Tax=Lentibacillus kapialis TaxID=340214 RepID=A0A917PWA8_9BACI|nr:M20/M25/M40 family metallo-hydrolase [Lentibacillus kapialis]GGJ94654.1 protein RocB [Lentibacillus kapialis]
MKKHMHSLPEPERIEALTRGLVQQASVNGTTGEVDIIGNIRHILAEFPYFQEHPDHLWLQTLPDDPLGRQNVFAFVAGNADAANTVLYHAHIDTVGVDDYGRIKDKAFSPDALNNFFSTYDAAPRVQAEAQSGDWLFGRGALDMKSGAAVHISNVLHFSENREELEGNLLLVINGDEESEHHGMTGALHELKRLQDEKNLDYVAAINNDFITPMFDGDETKYIYTGTAGKLLPAFHIYGREVHVGDTLAGIDPNFIAAKLTERLHNNYRLTEHVPGELILPPSCLYQRDTKPFYNVQTAPGSHLYFNYFLYEATPADVMTQLVQETQQACREAETYLKDQFEAFLDTTGLPQRDLSWNIDVTTYDAYVEELHERGIDTRSVIEQAIADNPDADTRTLSFRITGALQELDPDKRARVILFFAPPFLPHNYLKDSDPGHRQIKAALEAVLHQHEAKTGESFAVKKFFPYLADGSFLSLHETKSELNALLQNMPEWERLYPVPFETIQSLDIPSINMGVYGHDGHKWTERVYKPYSFGVLPGLIRDTTRQLLNGHITA